MKELKLGILTFHRSINYGAFLQCYSLLNRIEKDFSKVNVEVIDYCPKYEYDKYVPTLKNFVFGSKFNKQSLKSIIKNIGKLFLLPGILRKKKLQYEAFQKSYDLLKLSKEQWVSDDYKTFWRDIKDDYDVIIVGSDAVWECIVFDFPNAYFLPPELEVYKMSYAACSGRMNSQLMSNEQKQLMQAAWERFDYIGVRDAATEKFVGEIAPKCITHHNCDPTLFLNINDPIFSRDAVKKKLVRAGISLKKPIIGIMGGDKIGKMVRDFFGREYQLVAVYYPNRYADVYLADLTPFEWAVSFSFFKITFTRYFHGTIFSLKNGTPTISIDDWNIKGGSTSKLFDLLDRLNLLEHYFKKAEMLSEVGLERIKEKSIKFMNNFDAQKVKESIEMETNSFQGFKDKLSSFIKMSIE